MKTWQKVLVIGFAVYVGLALLVASVAGSWLVRAGWAGVRITTSDVGSASFAVPMAATEAALRIAGRGPVGIQLRSDLGDVSDLLPALEDLAGGLEEMPEGVLVNVHQDGDHVIIRKIGNRLRVEVNAATGEHVQIEAPDQAPRRLLRELRKVLSSRG